MKIKLEAVIDWFSPHRRIARKLRWLQNYAGSHDFTVATGEFARMASEFDNFQP